MLGYLAFALVLALGNCLPFHHPGHYGHKTGVVVPTEKPWFPEMGTEKPFPSNFQGRGKGFMLNLNFAGGAGVSGGDGNMEEMRKEKVKEVVKHILKTLKITKLFDLEEKEMKKMVTTMLEGFKTHVVEAVLEKVKAAIAKEKAELLNKVEENKTTFQKIITAEKEALKTVIEKAKVDIKNIVKGQVLP